MSSSRLPGKVLMDIGGLPLVVLVARRAARDGTDVVVATSDDPSDDGLAQILQKHGIKFVRGSLPNVLERFSIATQDMADGDICVRLTADNPVPDADFIRLAIDGFCSAETDYMSYGNDGIFVPYGLSVEVFRVGGLRNSLKGNPDSLTREHVTTRLRNSATPYLRPALPDFAIDLGHVRCTVDTPADLEVATRLFRNVADPVSIGWRELVARLQARLPDRELAKPVLGTVQLGMKYGRANQTGLPDDSSATSILHAAYGMGVRTFDTARDYGVSENRIGETLRAGMMVGATIITKLTPRTQSVSHGSESSLRQFVASEVEASRAALGLPIVPVLLLHRTSDLDFADGAVWQELLSLKSKGRIHHLGCSVQSPEELERALAEPDVKFIQMPFNILDWRWEKSIVGLRFRPDVEVHVRSAFLQGLLVCGDANVWPVIEGLGAETIVASLASLVQEFGRKSAADLCIAYLRAMSWINGIVVGVENQQQLHETFELWSEPCLTWAEIARLRNLLPQVPARLLNPALWPSR
jgi:spore coat polysaccharide biosynthesis protein SpsF